MSRDEAFAHLVRSDVRQVADSADSARLRTPEFVERWHDELVRQLASSELQFVGKRSELTRAHADLEAAHLAYVAAQAEWAAARTTYEATRAAGAAWRINQTRFRNAISERIAEAKRLRAGLDRAAPTAEPLAALIAAISEHKARVERGEAGDEVDDALWSVLDAEEIAQVARRVDAA